jgi:3-polyprenyl-4-hydroxybenzoate decarboxylase
MQLAAEAGAIIFPPIPTFYHQPNSIEDLVRSTVGRMLARIGIKNNRYRPWSL